MWNLLDHMVSLCLTFEDPPNFPQWVPHLTPASHARGAFLHVRPSCKRFWVSVPCSNAVSVGVVVSSSGSNLFSSQGPAALHIALERCLFISLPMCDSGCAAKSWRELLVCSHVTPL